MASLWNTDDSVFLQLIIVEAPYVKAFKTYVFDSPSSGSAEALRPVARGISLRGHHPLLHASKPECLPNQHRTDRDRHHQPYRPRRDGRRKLFHRAFRREGMERVPQPNFFVDIGYPIFPNETRDDFSATLLPELKENPPGLYRVHKTVITGQAPTSSIILWPPRSTYPITRKIMRNTHASPAGSTSLAPWPSSREEEKP